MRILTRMVILLYVTLGLFLSCFFIIFVSNWFDFMIWTNILHLIYLDDNLRIILGVFAGILLIMNFFVYRFFSVNVHQEKTIAFDNPSGRVSVSLLAMEDLIERVVAKLSDVKEVRASLAATKKGLKVKIRLILCSEVNIPEMTSHVQEIIKRKIQDTIGIDEPINIAVYVGKIVPEKIKEKQKGDGKKIEESEEGMGSHIPFRGYRA